jgi:hypothetical protein
LTNKEVKNGIREGEVSARGNKPGPEIYQIVEPDEL